MDCTIISIACFGLALGAVPLTIAAVIAARSSSIRPHNMHHSERVVSPDEALQARIKLIQIDSRIRRHF